jgi:hypothetical protein
MSSPKAPPPPDYSGIAAASQAAAQLSFQIQKEQLDWSKQQFAKTTEISDRIINDAIQRQDKLDASAAEDRARYTSVFQPLEDSLAKEAQDYSTPARREMRAGAAMSDVSQQFKVARAAAQDRLESFGIDPSQTRAAALDVNSRIAEAAARAGAGNQAREQTDAVSRALRSEAINVGRGYPGQVAQSYGLAMQGGQGAANTAFGNVQSGAATMGTPMQWGQMGTSALGTWGNALGQGFDAQMKRFDANQKASSGWGQALGLVGGIGLASMGMPTSSIGGKLLGFDEGGSVPESMSPSGGAVTDDVPAQGPTGAIQLNGGEFVVPKDVLNWKGEEFFQNTIKKAREAKQQAPAQPEVRQAVALGQHPAVRAAVGLPPRDARLYAGDAAMSDREAPTNDEMEQIIAEDSRLPPLRAPLPPRRPQAIPLR